MERLQLKQLNFIVLPQSIIKKRNVNYISRTSLKSKLAYVVPVMFPCVEISRSCVIPGYENFTTRVTHRCVRFRFYKNFNFNLVRENSYLSLLCFSTIFSVDVGIVAAAVVVVGDCVVAFFS